LLILLMREASDAAAAYEALPFYRPLALYKARNHLRERITVFLSTAEAVGFRSPLLADFYALQHIL